MGLPVDKKILLLLVSALVVFLFLLFIQLHFQSGLTSVGIKT